MHQMPRSERRPADVLVAAAQHHSKLCGYSIPNDLDMV
jgi:hypothetical protein